MREYIIGNFKGDTKEEIETSIEESVKESEEDTLFGLGVLFELY